jgi:hypothetical protein
MLYLLMMVFNQLQEIDSESKSGYKAYEIGYTLSFYTV